MARELPAGVVEREAGVVAEIGAEEHAVFGVLTRPRAPFTGNVAVGLNGRGRGSGRLLGRGGRAGRRHEAADHYGRKSNSCLHYSCAPGPAPRPRPPPGPPSPIGCPPTPSPSCT